MSKLCDFLVDILENPPHRMDFFDLDGSEYLDSYALTDEQKTAIKSKDAASIETTIASLDPQDLHKLSLTLGMAPNHDVNSIAQKLSHRFYNVSEVTIESRGRGSQVDALMEQIKEVGTLMDRGTE